MSRPLSITKKKSIDFQPTETVYDKSDVSALTPIPEHHDAYQTTDILERVNAKLTEVCVML